MNRWVAPGKVVLVGEYAVLDGAPAVVAAVDSGVGCAWEPGPSRIVEAPDTRFVGAALDAVGAPPGRWSFTPWNPAETATKAGLGSSAAATVVAVLAGLEAAGGDPSPDEVFAIASRVHHAVQGSGSGIDVAASAYGGVLRFEAGACRALPAVEPIVVWSGSSADTGPRVAQYLAWTDRAAFVRQSRAVVDRFPDDPVAALDEALHLLLEMSRQAGIDYWTPALSEIATQAHKHGGAAKPSGAGGGDSAVALIPDPEAAARFRQACWLQDLPVLPVRISGPARRLG